MTYFAHNGVDHATEIEAVAHQSTNPLLVVAFSIAVVAILGLTIYGLHRFGVINLSSKEGKQK
jgi:hypothetical protein